MAIPTPKPWPAAPDAGAADPGLDAAFEAERAEVVRTRSRWIWGGSIVVWVVSLLLLDHTVFTWGQALVVRAPELAVATAFVVWLRAPRRLAAIEGRTIAAAVVIGLVSAWGLLLVPPEKLAAKATSVALASLLVSALGGFGWRTNLAIGVITQATMLALLAAGAKSLLMLVLTSTGFAFAVALVAAAARDRLARAALATRRALVRANERLVQEDELKRRLFVNLAHDFRTPLAVIRGEAALLERASREGARSDEDRASLARIERNAVALTDLVDQLLDLARLEAGQMPVRARPCDVAALARDVAAQLAAPGGPEIVTSSEGRAVAEVDPGHAARILTNLVANALRQERATRVAIAVRGDGERVRIAVSDDGPGVPPERRELIFQRFVSFGRDGSTASGVGLPLARELAALNAGTLRLVDGAPETTFELVLPATSEQPSLASSRAAAPLPAPLPALAATSATPRRRLLVVEDHADMRALLLRTLGAGFEVDAVACVADALARLRGAPPAAVLSDVMLPDGTGYEVLAAVRARRELGAVPVLLVSALGQVDERVRGLAAGADDYLAKPFAPDELSRRLVSAIERAEAFRRELDGQRDAFLMEVHDGVSASLARASILLSAAGDERSDEVRRAEDAVRDGLDEVRAIPSLLAPRPASLAALAAEIRRALADACEASRLELTVCIEGMDDEQAEVPAAAAHALRRAAREATTNIVKHARARRVACSLRATASEIALRVEDDGEGFAAAGGGGRGLGILQRRARALGGRVQLGNRAEGGAFVEVSLPRQALS